MPATTWLEYDILMNIPSNAQILDFIQHNPILFAAFGVVLALLIANELHGHFTSGPRLSPGAAVRLINDRDALAIDVRQPSEFKRGHLLDAMNIPAAKLKDRLQELSKYKDRPIIIYSGMSGGALEPVKLLRSHGFGEVYALRGGINSWTTSNLPVTIK